MWPFSSQKHKEASELFQSRTLREARREELNSNLEALGLDARFGGGMPMSCFAEAVEEIALMVTRSELERERRAKLTLQPNAQSPDAV